MKPFTCSINIDLQINPFPMTSFPYPQFLTPTISSSKPLLHRSFICAHRPSSSSLSASAHTRRIFIGLGGSLLLISSAPSFFSKTRRDPNRPSIQMDGAEAAAMDGEFPRLLDSAVKTKVKRPGKAKSGEEEVLVVDGIEVYNNARVKIDVMVNVDDWSTCGPGSTQFAGSFVHVPRKPWDPEGKVRTCLRLGITELLEEIGADGDGDIMVTLVPRGGSDVKVGGVRIEYSS